MNKWIHLFSAAALFIGCKSEAPSTGTQPSASTASMKASLTGAGATFPYPLYTKWIAEFTKANPGSKINYESIGSGGGIRQVTERTVDFGASDAPMTEEQLKQAPGLVHIPTALGAVAIAYNVEGVTSLKLTPDALSGIFLGRVKAWNDPLIAQENPDAKLPEKPITTVHRSDGSGTTKIFADYLSAVSSDWKASPGTGTSLSWPGGLGAKGNDGVTALVASTPNSLGYVELAYAIQNKLNVAAIKNKAGAFVVPSVEGATKAAEGSLPSMPDDMRLSIVNADGASSYPISGFTYLLVYREQKEAAKAKLLVSFIQWAVHEGQSMSKALHYAPLPEGVVRRVETKLKSLLGPDQKPLL